MKMKQILNRTALNKAKLSVLSASITALICSSVGASDIDIYKAPASSAGATTVMMMLDVSGSMRVTHPAPDVAWKACDNGVVKITSFPEYITESKTITVNGKDLQYTRYLCKGGTTSRDNFRFKKEDVYRWQKPRGYDWNYYYDSTVWKDCNGTLESCTTTRR